MSPLLTLMLHQEIVNGLYRQVQMKCITVEQACASLPKVQPSLDCAAQIIDAMSRINCDYADSEQIKETLLTVIRAGKWASTHTDIMPLWTADAIIRGISGIHERSDHAIAYELRKVLDKVKEQTQ